MRAINAKPCWMAWFHLLQYQVASQMQLPLKCKCNQLLLCTRKHTLLLSSNLINTNIQVATKNCSVEAPRHAYAKHVCFTPAAWPYNSLGFEPFCCAEAQKLCCSAILLFETKQVRVSRQLQSKADHTGSQQSASTVVISNLPCNKWEVDKLSSTLAPCSSSSAIISAS